MLEMDRVDVVVANRIDGLQTIKEMLLNDIRILEPPLLTLNSYHYLHRKRADILPKITKVLQAMTTEGRIAAIYKAHVDALRVNQ